jgi:hypothetical protein
MKRILWVMALLVGSVLVGLAQNGTTTFISTDGTLTLQHPRTWSVADRGEGLISLTGETFFATLLTPPTLSAYAEIRDPARLAQTLIAERFYTPQQVSVFTSNNQTVARYDYSSPAVPNGFFLVFPLGEGFLAFQVTAQGDDRLVQRDLEVLVATLVYDPNAEPPAAQNIFTAADGTTLQYPRTWEITDNADGTFMIQAADFTATLATPTALAAFSQYTDPARLVTAALERQGLQPLEFEVFSSNRRPAARFDYRGTEREGFFLALTLPNGLQILLDVIPTNPAGNAAPIQRDLEILGSTLTLGNAVSSVVAPTTVPATPVPVLTTFASQANTLQFTYGNGWFVSEDDEGKIYGFLGEPAVSLTIYTPEELLEQRYLMNGEAPADFLARYRANLGFELGAIETVTIGDYAAAQRPVTVEAGGIFVALQLPTGAYLVAEGFMFAGEWTAAAERAVLAILATLTYSGEVVAQENPTAAPFPELTQTANGWRDAIPELEALALIPFGGRNIADERYLYFVGVGDTAVRFNSLTATTDFVMAGQLDYDPTATPAEGDYCAFSVRRTLGIETPGELNFGVTADGFVFYDDLPADENTPRRTETARLETAITEPHQFLIIAIQDRLTLYLNGKPIFVEVEVETRSGLAALIIKNTVRGASCEGRNMWLYSLPEAESDVCEIQTVGVVNKRSGPGTNFGIVAELPGFSAVPIIGREVGADGFVWWQLEDETWVREDVVNVVGNCGAFLETSTDGE